MYYKRNKNAEQISTTANTGNCCTTQKTTKFHSLVKIFRKDIQQNQYFQAMYFKK